MNAQTNNTQDRNAGTQENTNAQKGYKVWHLLLTVVVMALTIRVGLGAVELPEPTQANYYLPPTTSPQPFRPLPVNADTLPGPKASESFGQEGALASVLD